MNVCEMQAEVDIFRWPSIADEVASEEMRVDRRKGKILDEFIFRGQGESRTDEALGTPPGARMT